MSGVVPQPVRRGDGPPSRQRRSRYRGGRFRINGPLGAVALLALLAVVAGILFGTRVFRFVHATTGGTFNPLQITNVVTDSYPQGTVGRKLKQDKQRVNLLLLGYGGVENDAPWLTDSIMVVELDPVSNRVAMISVPRDLWVAIRYNDGPRDYYYGKVNEAFAAGQDDSGLVPSSRRKDRYRGRDGGGNLAMDTVGRQLNIKFDGYIGVDFVAFRDVVNALGGITVHMDYPLDDCHYPDYHEGYMNHGVPDYEPCPYNRFPQAGIHYKAGTYQVDGEQALQIARSRKADEPEQATDFGRARRQQMILTAIKERAAGVNGIVKAPQLMDALQKNFQTNLNLLNDLTPMYQWGKNLKQSDFIHLALSTDNLLDGGINACGDNGGAYTLCPFDATYTIVRDYVAHAFYPPDMVKTAVPLQVVSSMGGGIEDQVSATVGAYGYQLGQPTYIPGYNTTTTVYDFSGGADSLALNFLSDFLTAAQGHAPQVISAADPNAKIPRGVNDNKGLVLYLGTDWRDCWYGNAPPRCKR